MYILRTTPYEWEGKIKYGYADGTCDYYVDGKYSGLRIEASHKIKWAEEFTTKEDAEKHRSEYPNGSEFEVIEYEIAAKEYYNR